MTQTGNRLATQGVIAHVLSLTDAPIFGRYLT
jgi:hypothetical protein